VLSVNLFLTVVCQKTGSEVDAPNPIGAMAILLIFESIAALILTAKLAKYFDFGICFLSNL
jgi:hypothetical protein